MTSSLLEELKKMTSLKEFNLTFSVNGAKVKIIRNDKKIMSVVSLNNDDNRTIEIFHTYNQYSDLVHVTKSELESTLKTILNSKAKTSIRTKIDQLAYDFVHYCSHETNGKFTFTGAPPRYGLFYNGNGYGNLHINSIMLEYNTHDGKWVIGNKNVIERICNLLGIPEFPIPAELDTHRLPEMSKAHLWTAISHLSDIVEKLAARDQERSRGEPCHL